MSLSILNNVFVFQIVSLQLLIDCMDDQEFVINLDYAILIGIRPI